MPQTNLFADTRISRTEAVELTNLYLKDYFDRYKNVAIAFSGGKDSTAVVSVVINAIESGIVRRPESLTVIYADTRLELPPLHDSAMAILEDVRQRGFNTVIAKAPIDKRMLCYILGRGVPPPNNNTLRYCTNQIKIQPMHKAIEGLRDSLPDGERLLMLTGVRLGESAIRDRRILTSCSKDGGECGQGWFQNSTYDRTDTFAPIIHWRVCHIWDWLIEGEVLHGFPTLKVAEVYGGDERQEINARTGCIGCPLASKDLALDNLIASSKYAYLAPLKGMRTLYEQMRLPQYRHRKIGETLKDGRPSSNPDRMGPLTLEARAYFLDRVLEIQSAVNAQRGDNPELFLIDAEEEAFIRQCHADKVFPNRWDDSDRLAIESVPTPLEVLLSQATSQFA